ncbi:hypothetical protein R1sor_024601 [Riccia sorocarpa]|uniref:Uncharacterized protein n=1 Tax=Riccia sorocarpa TaxID=122646 RepID=A0ABD3GQY5_9MARC
MVWTHLGAKLAREQMSEATMLEYDPAAIGRLAVDDIMASRMQTYPLPPVRNTQPASGSQPAPPMRGSKKKKKKEASSPKRKKAIPETSLIPPNGVPGEVCLGIRVNVEEFKKDFTSGDRVWSSGKLNIRDNCSNVFLKTNWEKWRKQAQPPYLPPKAEVRKSFLQYASLELHGVKMDWTTVDLSQATNTVSYERKMAARRELFRMRVRMDGWLVETMDPDEMEKSQKGNRPRKQKRRLASEKADGVPSTDNSLPQETPPVRVNPSTPANTSGVATKVTGGMIAAMKPVLERTQKGKQKVSEAPTELEDLRMLKTTLNLSLADQYKEPSIGSPTGQTSGRDSNQPVSSENPVDDRICSIGLMEESASNLATHTMSHLTLVLEEHKCVRQHQADLEDRLAEIEKENLALSNKVHTLEAEKQHMSDRWRS